MRPLRTATLITGLVVFVWLTTFLVFISSKPKRPPVNFERDPALRQIVANQTDYRAIKVKAAFKFAWDAYSQHAFGHDEIGPVSGTAKDTRNGYGATIVDALSTAILMGLDDIVEQQVKHILSINWYKQKPTESAMSPFETTIRYLGGVLSGVDLIQAGYSTLSNEMADDLLLKAKDLGDIMTPMFNTDSGLAAREYTIGQPVPGHDISIATSGTLLLEWGRLSDLLGVKEYRDLANVAYTYFLKPAPAEARVWPGLLPTWMSARDGRFQVPNNGGFGGENDSYYEYLIKLALYDSSYIDLGKSWIEAMKSTMKHLVSTPKGSPNTTLVSSWNSLTEANKDTKDMLSYQGEHLACFLGGNVILGSRFADSVDREMFLEFGKNLTDGCHDVGASTALGLVPESFQWDPSSKTDTSNDVFSIRIRKDGWVLRPEVLESYFYAYRETHDERYRDWAWSIFEIMEKHSRAKYGYASLSTVVHTNPTQVDYQESFLFAETLKYLYLIFCDDDLLPLDKFVLNTEGHPLRIKG